MCAKMLWVFAVLAIFSLVACSSEHSGPVPDDLVGDLDLPNEEEELSDLVEDLDLPSEEEEPINDEQALSLSNVGDEGEEKRGWSIFRLVGRKAAKKLIRLLGKETLDYYIKHHDKCLARKCDWGNKYRCHKVSNFNYGCKKGYCWSGCTATPFPKEWCWVKGKRGGKRSGVWMKCRKDADCKNGALCDKAYCSGGCSIGRK